MHPSSSKKYDFLNSESSSDNSVSASFFLKKEPKQNDEDDDSNDDVDIDSDDIAHFKNKSQAGKLKASSSKNSFFADLIKSPDTKPMDALSRFQQLENQIKSRQQNHAKLLQSLSDLEISSDESIKKELEKLKKSSSKFKDSKKESGDVAAGSSSSAMTKQNTTTAEVSSSIPNVNEFLKPAKIPSPTRSRDQPKLTSVMKKRPSDSRKSVSFDLDNTKYSMDDDGDESLNSLIIASSSSSDVTTSLDEIIESNLQNVLSLDDLVMGQDLQHDDQDSSSRGFQQNFQTIDNLVAISDRPSSRTSVSSVSSAVVAAGDRKTIDKRIKNSNMKLQQLDVDDNNSVSTTTTIATATNNTSSYNSKKMRRKRKKMSSSSVERSRSPKTTSISEMSGMSSSAAQEVADDDDDDYSAGFETPSRSDTLKDTESIASEIRETDDSSSYDGDSTFTATSSTVTTMTQTSYDVTNDYTTMTSSADDTTTRTNTTAASYSVRKSKRKTRSRKPAVKNVKSCSVQTSPIRITKDYPEIPPELFSFYQPSHTNLLTHQSLALLTTHSPALLALQDVLKRQLQLTKDFVARSNALYEYQERALSANHHYTTLSDVTKIINKHRKKHNLPPMKTFS